MLPVLVLLVASSALAAPGAISILPVPSNALSYNDNSVVGRALSGIDTGDINVNELNIDTILRELSRQGGKQALANGQTIAYLGEVATGRPGDSCEAANYIDAYVKYVSSGNSAGVRAALRKYIQVLVNNIDNIVGLVTNKESVKYKSGSRGGCAGEGRTYQLDAAWDIILGQNQHRLIDEESCVAKRLYCSLSAASNNVGAQITASALPPSLQVFELCKGQLKDFLSRLEAKRNLGPSAASLKKSLISAVGRVNV